MEKVNQFQLDVDMMDMDGETSMNQISTKSSEKATAQHHRKEVEGKKASTRSPDGCDEEGVRGEDSGDHEAYQ